VALPISADELAPKVPSLECCSGLFALRHDLFAAAPGVSDSPPVGFCKNPPTVSLLVRNAPGNLICAPRIVGDELSVDVPACCFCSGSIACWKYS